MGKGLVHLGRIVCDLGWLQSQAFGKSTPCVDFSFRAEGERHVPSGCDSLDVLDLEVFQVEWFEGDFVAAAIQ